MFLMYKVYHSLRSQLYGKLLTHKLSQHNPPLQSSNIRQKEEFSLTNFCYFNSFNLCHTLRQMGGNAMSQFHPIMQQRLTYLLTHCNQLEKYDFQEEKYPTLTTYPLLFHSDHFQ